jgi:hypothetical protein
MKSPLAPGSIREKRPRRDNARTQEVFNPWIGCTGLLTAILVTSAPVESIADENDRGPSGMSQSLGMVSAKSVSEPIRSKVVTRAREPTPQPRMGFHVHGLQAGLWPSALRSRA